MKYPLTLFVIGFSLITALGAVYAGDDGYATESENSFTASSNKAGACSSNDKNAETGNHLIRVVVALESYMANELSGEGRKTMGEPPQPPSEIASASLPDKHYLVTDVAFDRVYDIYVVDAFADEKRTRLQIGDAVYHPESNYSF